MANGHGGKVPWEVFPADEFNPNTGVRVAKGGWNPLRGNTGTLGQPSGDAVVVTGAVGGGDGVYRPDGTFNGKPRYVHESNPRQEILWIQIGGTAWHITTDRKQPTDGAWTYKSVPESNPERPATHGWEVDNGRYLPTVTLQC